MKPLPILPLALASLAAFAAPPDAPPVALAGHDARPSAERSADAPRTYGAALEAWRNADDVNAWIAAHFRYDAARALQLSESWRQRNPGVAILAPEALFADPHGVCVDLARFGVETLRAIDPAAKPAYLMIEFEPASFGGETLRRHWIATFEREGQRYFFADSQRPGHLAGPYASTAAFVAEYGDYRARRVVAYREADDYARRARAMAQRKAPAESP